MSQRTKDPFRAFAVSVRTTITRSDAEGRCPSDGPLYGKVNYVCTYLTSISRSRYIIEKHHHSPYCLQNVAFYRPTLIEWQQQPKNE